MATQGSDIHRDDGMTAGGPGPGSQNPPAFGAPASGTTNDGGDTADQSAPDSESTPAQATPQTSGVDPTHPADSSASPSPGQDAANSAGSASTAGPGATSATTHAGNGTGSGSTGNGDGAANTASGVGSTNAASGGDGSTNTAGGDGSTDAGSGAGVVNTASDGSALQLAGAGAPLQPIFDAANTVVDEAFGSSGLVQGIVDVANTAGLGAIGATPSADGHSNLITDVVNLPGDILDGNLNAGVSHIAADLSDTVNAATGLVGGVAGDTGSLPGNGALDGDGLLHPVTGLIDSAGTDLQSVPLVNVNGGGLLNGGLGDLNGSPSGNLIHVTAGPQDNSGLGLGVLASPDSSHTAGLSAIGGESDGPQIADLNILSSANVLSTPALDGLGAPLTGTASSGGLLIVNGGNNAGDGGVIGGTIGDLNGSSGGHLIDAAAGPQNNQSVDLGVLTGNPDSGHTATASAVDVGPSGPQLADLGILTDPHALTIASLNGAGTDSLAGGLPGGDIATETLAGAVQPTPVATNLGDIQDLLSVPAVADHGILDVNHAHII